MILMVILLFTKGKSVPINHAVEMDEDERQ